MVEAIQAIRAGKARFVLLLAALFVLLAVGPLFGTDPSAQAELAALFSLIVLCLATTSYRTALALACSAFWIILTWTEPLGDGAIGEVAEDLALIVLCGLAIESALRRALTADFIDKEALAAVGCAYLLLGVGWAAIYTLIEAIQPGAFHLTQQEAGEPWSPLLYFSFATLTTLGYGDVTPIAPVARGWAGVQAVVGTLFTAVLIARLVSLYGNRNDG